MSRFQLYLTCAIRASLRAGKVILEVYNSDFEVEHKADHSPLTEADKQAHTEISKTLKNFDPNIPILSEEGRSIPYRERAEWDFFWVVDPLDGTKEFVKRNGEFTVNIALIQNGAPLAGVIYVPVADTLYFGLTTKGAWRIDEFSRKEWNGEDLDSLKKLGIQLPLVQKRPFTVVASRSHLSPETQNFIDALEIREGQVDILSCGSSLKLCMVAEGSADVYPRFAPTMEWDTAAGQAIAMAAGKEVVRHGDEKPLTYNKKDLLNPWFIVR